MKPENLLKFTVITEFLVHGKSKTVIRKNQVPKIHATALKELYDLMQGWINKYSK